MKQWKNSILGAFVLTVIVLPIKWFFLDAYDSRPIYYFLIDFITTWLTLFFADFVGAYIKSKKNK